MAGLILLCAVFILLGERGSSQSAPGDRQSQCLDTSTSNSLGQGLVGAYTSTQKPLLDSYWYGSLFGTGAVWESIQGNEGSRGVRFMYEYYLFMVWGCIIAAWFDPVLLPFPSGSGLEGWPMFAAPRFKLGALKIPLALKTIGWPHSSSPGTLLRLPPIIWQYESTSPIGLPFVIVPESMNSTTTQERHVLLTTHNKTPPTTTCLELSMTQLLR